MWQRSFCFGSVGMRRHGLSKNEMEGSRWSERNAAGRKVLGTNSSPEVIEYIWTCFVFLGVSTISGSLFGLRLGVKRK